MPSGELLALDGAFIFWSTTGLVAVGTGPPAQRSLGHEVGLAGLSAHITYCMALFHGERQERQEAARLASTPHDTA